MRLALASHRKAFFAERPLAPALLCSDSQVLDSMGRGRYWHTGSWSLSVTEPCVWTVFLLPSHSSPRRAASQWTESRPSAARRCHLYSAPELAAELQC